MEVTISRIIGDIEDIHHQSNSAKLNIHQLVFISESTLLDIQTLLDDALNTSDSEFLDHLYEELASKNLSPSSLIRPIASTMDSAPLGTALLASRVFLSLLLAPNAPVFTLFTPMAFLSLLQSIRRYLKNRQRSPQDPDEQSHSSKAPTNKKRKGGGQLRRSRNVARGSGSRYHESEDSEFDVRVLFCLLERLELVLGLVHLDRFPDNLKSLIQTVADIPVMALELGNNMGHFNKLTDLCWRLFSEVLKPDHGDPQNTAAELLKSLSPLIFLVKSHARTFALGFVTKRMMGVAKDFGGVKKAIVNLPRYLVLQAPEKAEPRASAVESIVEIVRAMEIEEQSGFAEYAVKMTQGKAKLRLLAVDLIPMLMMLLRDTSLVNPEDMKGSCEFRCLEALIHRCSDASVVIRARALSNLAHLVGSLSGHDRRQAMLKEAMGLVKVESHEQEGMMNDLLRKRCTDEKAAVRKAALLLVTKLTALLGGSVDGVLLKTMGMACSDPLISIRKAAISALSETFRVFSDEAVTIEWLHSVPRLITDNEASIQEDCENLFLELVLNRVAKAGFGSLHHKGSANVGPFEAKNIAKEIELLVPEGVLGLLKEICNGEVAPWVKKICTNLGKKKRLKPEVAVALQNIIRTSESLWLSHSLPIEKWTAPPGVWFLLSEVSTYLSKAVDWEFLHHHWQLLDKDEVRAESKGPNAQGDVHEEEENIESNSVNWAGDRVFLLQTISNVSVELPAEPAADLAHNLLTRIEEFNMHSTEVNAHVKALRTLCRRKALSSKEADTLVVKWVHQLLSKASQIIEKYISCNSEENKHDSFFTPPRSRSGKEKRSATMSRSLSQSVTAVYTIGCLVLVCPSANMGTIIPVLHTIITSGNSDPKLNKLPGATVSLKQTAPSLYTHAWLTMGKICLADGKVAKRYIPLFVQELEKSDLASLRNNLVVMMADFCVHHTALVDCYIANITKCLRDPCELVRRQTFVLLSRLLQRDYVKWRGVLFLRFLLSLVDESEKIRQLGDFLFGNILKVKAPLLAYNSFIEAIFVLNDCHAHAHHGHSDSQTSRAESKLFSIRGNDERSRSKRMHIYASLLKQMAPEHLLATFAKLCAEILAAASDGMLNIEDITGQSVLQDAFQILSCKEIRIQSNSLSSSDPSEMDEEAGDGGATAAAAAKGRAITQVVRKSLIQNTVPIFIELKRLLEGKNSPLMGSLMECLRIILKDYKNEIDDILVADKQLQKELIYDMQKYEAAKVKSTAAEAVAAMQKPSSCRTPIMNSMAKSRGDSKLASAMAEVAAQATVRSVLREVNAGTLTPPLSSIRPKLKSAIGGASQGDRPSHVLESLRRRQCFDSDDES